MKAVHRSSILPFLLASGALTAPSLSLAQPMGWLLTGRGEDRFEAARDDRVTVEGKPTARLTSNVASAQFGSLAQFIDADEYRGKRIRFATVARTEEVPDWAGLWLRIDAPNNAVRAYMDTQDTPLRGYSDWVPLKIVIDVPDDARTVYFGLGQNGSGTSWFGPVTFEIVDTEVPVNPQPKISNQLERTLVTCRKEAPTGSHIPRHACYDIKRGRINWLASAEYVHGLKLAGVRQVLVRGWRWYWR